MSPITLTERAARRINEIMAAEPQGSMLRISVNGGGCSGFQYAFDVERARQADDLLVERDGAAVLVDQVSLQYMDGSVVDFVDDLIGQSFKIENPHATASCGCGTSFLDLTPRRQRRVRDREPVHALDPPPGSPPRGRRRRHCRARLRTGTVAGSLVRRAG